jgi:hypothetical protein
VSPRSRPALRYALLAVLGVLTGLLVSQGLLPAIFGRQSVVVALGIALLAAVVLIVWLLRRRGSRP